MVGADWGPMKKIAFMTAVALVTIPAMAESATTPTTTTSAATAPENCPASCSVSANGVQCGDQEWLNVETVTLEAANGDPLAQYTVAWLSDTGKGMPQDSDKAADMYGKALPGLEKAAQDGNPAACLALARMYADGKGVDKNPDMAKKYMEMYKSCKGKDCHGKDCKGKDAPAASADKAA